MDEGDFSFPHGLGGEKQRLEHRQQPAEIEILEVLLGLRFSGGITIHPLLSFINSRFLLRGWIVGRVFRLRYRIAWVQTAGLIMQCIRSPSILISTRFQARESVVTASSIRPRSRTPSRSASSATSSPPACRKRPPRCSPNLTPPH